MELVQPIINGSFNPRFTLEMFGPLTLKEKQQALWSLVCSFARKESFPGVEELTFSSLVPQPDFPITIHSEIYEKDEEELTQIFGKTVAIREDYFKSLMDLTKERLWDKGQQIYRIQQKLGFGGFLEMDLYRLKGYMEECGNWNDFNPTKISQQLNRVEANCPKKDYGVNNPSTGLPMHIYRTVSGCEYVNIYFPFLSEREVEKVVEFYKNVWEPVGQEVIADSVRMVEEKDGPYSSIELIWWWD